MKVIELIHALQIQDPDSDVYCASKSNNVFDIFGIDLHSYCTEEYPNTVFLGIQKIPDEKIKS